MGQATITVLDPIDVLVPARHATAVNDVPAVGGVHADMTGSEPSTLEEPGTHAEETYEEDPAVTTAQATVIVLLPTTEEVPATQTPLTLNPAAGEEHCEITESTPKTLEVPAEQTADT